MPVRLLRRPTGTAYGRHSVAPLPPSPSSLPQRAFTGKGSASRGDPAPKASGACRVYFPSLVKLFVKFMSPRPKPPPRLPSGRPAGAGTCRGRRAVGIFRLERFALHTIRPSVSWKKRGHPAWFGQGGPDFVAVLPRVVSFSKRKRSIVRGAAGSCAGRHWPA